MKKSIIIFGIVLITISLTAFAFINRNDSVTNQFETSVTKDVAINKNTKEKTEKRIFSDFIYDIGPRFNSIKKGDLDKVKTFSDFIGEEHANRIVSYKSLKVFILENDERIDTKETSDNGEFTAAQINLLQSFDYSTNLLIIADYQGKNKETGKLEDTQWTPYLTIVPEKQAEYISGKDALMTYLKDNSEDARVNVDADKLQPAKLFFTVTKTGSIENVKLDRSSGYPEVDKTMIELIHKAPGKWQPAENINGEKVDQELVVSFGLMGC